MQNSFKEKFEKESITYNLDLALNNDDFIHEISSIIANNEKEVNGLKYVYFVNHAIAKYIRIQLCSTHNQTSKGKVDIDSFYVNGVHFRVEQNRVSDINIVRPDVKQIVHQDYHKIILLKIQ